MRSTLEKDDVSSYGPETTFFEGTGHCRSPWAIHCDMAFKVYDYGRNGVIKTGSGAVVTLYHGAGIAGVFKVADADDNAISRDKNWWHVFTLDGRRNRIKYSSSPASGGFLQMQPKEEPMNGTGYDGLGPFPRRKWKRRSQRDPELANIRRSFFMHRREVRRQQFQHGRQIQNFSNTSYGGSNVDHVIDAAYGVVQRNITKSPQKSVNNVTPDSDGYNRRFPLQDMNSSGVNNISDWHEVIRRLTSHSPKVVHHLANAKASHSGANPSISKWLHNLTVPETEWHIKGLHRWDTKVPVLHGKSKPPSESLEKSIEKFMHSHHHE